MVEAGGYKFTASLDYIARPYLIPNKIEQMPKIPVAMTEMIKQFQVDGMPKDGKLCACTGHGLDPLMYLLP